jgi:hypothetical protein
MWILMDNSFRDRELPTKIHNRLDNAKTALTTLPPALLLFIFIFSKIKNRKALKDSYPNSIFHCLLTIKLSLFLLSLLFITIESSPSIRSYGGSVPRRRGLVDSPKPCLTKDEGGPFEAAMQVEASNHRKLLRSKAVVVSVTAKRRGKTPSGMCHGDEQH